MNREFTVIIERDARGFYVASVPTDSSLATSSVADRDTRAGPRPTPADPWL